MKFAVNKLYLTNMGELGEVNHFHERTTYSTFDAHFLMSLLLVSLRVDRRA